MSRYNKLPVFHVYTPITLSKVVTEYFQTNSDESECYLVGEWQRRAGKPGVPPTQGSSSAEVAVEEDTTNVITRSRTRSKMRSTNNSSSSDAPHPSSSRSRDEDELKFKFGPVLAVNILGLSSTAKGSTLPHENLQIIGKVFKSPTTSLMMRQQEGRDVPDEGQFMFHCHVPEAKAGDIKFPFVTLGHSCFDLSSFPRTQLILFEYDPTEFQRWKIPQTYPIGVPSVLHEGISILQNMEEDTCSRFPNFTPAFPSVPLDHQNLEACFELSPSSYFCTLPGSSHLIERSSGVKQMAYKASILSGTFLGEYHWLPVLNFLFLLAVDSLIGLLVSSYFLQDSDLFITLQITVAEMLERLNHLLKWIKGAPAGLKLNENLNSLYFRFFSYHIHLWVKYIRLLEPLISLIIYTIQYFGVLGVTIQITFLKDLLCVVTFHVYCLYIYAARLYALQISAIKALSRVFFGRKYNPLRNRIDHVQLTTSELFLSSFGFVILIFLFPTTLVYYAVFVCLRVPALMVERLLDYIVSAYNNLPLISWLLVFLRSPRVADEVYLVPKQGSSNDANHYNGSGSTNLNFRVCLQSTRTLFIPPDFGRGIKILVSSLLSGTVLKC